MKKPLRIALLGSTGRIGSGIIQLVEADDKYVISQKITRQQLEEKMMSFEDVDVIVDFSLPKATIQLITFLKENKINKPLMIGTTGFDDDQSREIHQIAKECPVIQTSNTSLSIGLMCQFAEKASSILGKDYEILITEVHHKHKVDSPSGTAKMLAQACMNGGAREPHIQASRLGDVKGTHELTFFGPYDRIVIRHEADDRQLFCKGALILAQWITDQSPGKLFSIQDFLKNQS